MAINERLVHTASAAAGAGAGNQEEGLMLHLDASDVDSYDGDGEVWYDIKDHEYKPATNVSEHFNTVTYTGNSGSKTVTGVGFTPDLVWIKNRDGAFNHLLRDTVRGNNSVILPNATTVESTGTGAFEFLSDGFRLPIASSGANNSSYDYVAWCFKAGGAAVPNTNGSIQSQVSANDDLGFSIVKYNGNATSGATVGHGLGVNPELIIVKNLDTAVSWGVWSTEIGLTEVLRLDQNTASTTPGTAYFTPQNNTGSVFGLGTNNETNDGSDDYIAYCFASKRGVSKVGSYKGTGASGNKVYTGFEPAFLMQKETNTSGVNWHIWDNVRDSNPIENVLSPNTSSAEGPVSSGITFNRDGFTINTTNGSINGNGDNYIFYAVAKNTNETELATTSSGVWSGFQNAVTSITSDSNATTNAPGTADTATTHSIFDTANTFSMGTNGTTEASNEIFITLNAPKSIKGFAVYEMYQSGYRYTGTTKLYGSTDNSNWYLLGSTVQNTNVASPSSNRNETTFAATPEYQYYKFTLSANTRGTYQGAWAFELIADFDVTPSLHLDPASYSGSGTTWTADTGNNGTLVGNTAYDQELGDFFDLDGSGDYISLNSSGYLTGDFTVEMWWNFDTLSGYKMLWGGQGYSGGTGLGHYINGNTLFTYISVSGAAVSPTGQSGAVLTAGKWHHIVLTRSGGTYTQYVDGANVGSGAGSTTSLESANTYIGAHYNNTAYNVDGRVGQVRVYSSALTQDKIRQNFNFTKNDYPNGINADRTNTPTWNPSGYWDFDGGTSNCDSFFLPQSLTLNPWFTNTHTVSMWVNFDSFVSVSTFWATYDYAGASYGTILRADADGRIRQAAYFSNSSTNQFSSALNTGQWYHIVGSFSQGDCRLYIDKVHIGTNTATFNYPSGGGRPVIGALRHSNSTTTDNGHDGKISKFKLYDRFLTTEEIQALHSEGY